MKKKARKVKHLKGKVKEGLKYIEKEKSRLSKKVESLRKKEKKLFKN